MLSIGQQIESYEIVAPLSSGGMATLYLGRKSGVAGFSRLVAIKVIHSHLAADENFVQMFLDEALLCARIQHPNVVHVEELGEADGSYFLAMEFVHGVPLSQMLKELSKRGLGFTPEVAVAIVMAVADGLHAAHETLDDDGQLLGVVHRDVTPQNVLLSQKGHIKLIDFGIAKSRSRANQTVAGTLKGKFRYMSPEQAMARDVDRRTDVYALGIVLWEMLTMRRLFKGHDDVELLLQAQKPKVVPPKQINEAISDDLSNAVMRALAVSPADRPPTAQAFRALLSEAMPKSARLSTSSVGGMVRELFGDELKKRIHEVPESVSKLLRVGEDASTPSKATPSHVVTELTVSAGTRLHLDDDDSGAGLGAASLPSVVRPASRRWPIAALLVSFAVILAVGGAMVFRGADSADSTDRRPSESASAPESAAGPETQTAPLEIEEEDRDQDPALAGQSPAADAGATAVAPSAVQDLVGDESQATTTMVEDRRRRRRGRTATAMQTDTTESAGAPPTMMAAMMRREPSIVHGTPIAEEVPF